MELPRGTHTSPLLHPLVEFATDPLPPTLRASPRVRSFNYIMAKSPKVLNLVALVASHMPLSHLISPRPCSCRTFPIVGVVLCEVRVEVNEPLQDQVGLLIHGPDIRNFCL